MTSRPHMRKVKASNTTPELKLRQLLCSMGFRGYRLHYKKLPSKPDIVFVSRRKVIFVHGCFWHGHDCKAGRNIPQTNQEYWVPKLRRNRERDEERLLQLINDDWKVLIVWECQLKQPESVREKLIKFMQQ